MKKLVGAMISSATVLVLAACAPSVAPVAPSDIPTARKAHVTGMTIRLPAQASLFGVVTYGAFTSDEVTTFSEPYFPVAFDAAGDVVLALPTAVSGGFSEYPGCPFGGHAALGMIFALRSPAASGSVSASSITGRYRLESGGAHVTYWYSPVTEHVSCVSSERGNMSAGRTEVWDAQLVAGWNPLLMYVRVEATFIRTGVPTAATWEPIVR